MSRPEDTAEHQALRAEIVDGPGAFHRTSHSTSDLPPTLDAGAIAALSLAILSWLILPIVGAIAALLIAPGAKHRIRKSEGALEGRGLATAAQVIGAANIALGFLVVWLLVRIIESIA